MEQKRIVLATKGIVWDGRRALILRRTKDDPIAPGTWEFPGGKFAFGETPEDCTSPSTASLTFSRRLHGNGVKIWNSIRGYSPTA